MGDSVDQIETVGINDLISGDFASEEGAEAPEAIDQDAPEDATGEDNVEAKKEKEPKAEEATEKEIKPRWKDLKEAEKSFREQQSLSSKKEAELNKRIKELEEQASEKAPAAEEKAKEAPAPKDDLAVYIEAKGKALNLKRNLINEIKEAKATGNKELQDELSIELEDLNLLLEMANSNIETEKENRLRQRDASEQKRKQLEGKIAELSAKYDDDEITESANAMIKEAVEGRNVEQYDPLTMIFENAALKKEIARLKKKGGNAPELEGPGKKKAPSGSEALTELQKVILSE